MDSYHDVESAVDALEDKISGLNWNSKADQLKIQREILNLNNPYNVGVGY